MRDSAQLYLPAKPATQNTSPSGQTFSDSGRAGSRVAVARGGDSGGSSLF